MPNETRELPAGERRLSPLDHAVNAFYKQLVEHAIKLIEKKHINFELIRTVAENVRAEDDRSCAIILGSLVDEIMQDLILAECNDSVPRLRARLFDPQSGMLPNFARRIFFSVSLKLITQETFHNLNILRKIRNEFAHNIACNSFDHQRIRGLLASIAPSHEKVLEAAVTAAINDDKSIEESTPARVVAEHGRKRRFFFIVECGFMLNDLVAEMIVFPEAQRKGVNPRDILAVGFDKQPYNLRKMNLSAMRLILEAVNAKFELKIDLSKSD